MRAVLKNGNNAWNGGEFYGLLDYNSLIILERYFKKYPEDAEKAVICIKGSINSETHQPDASPKNTRRILDPRRMHYTAKGLKAWGTTLSEVRAETAYEAAEYTKEKPWGLNFCTACAQYDIPIIAPGGFEANIRLVEQVEEMTKTKSCTPTQLAINWMRAQDLTDDEMARIDAVLANSVPAGGRRTDAAPIDN
ncbi:hypothetical protein NUW58_g4142 [Xylaria curta]|uniref:Uncharacterized protein n=1 Tax=Xylaria curta TaxID=42375 RepID=A0ACC1P906_9PEZI|nr:hypothetical protein NUW58_g4142 [Xylaria curta]